MKREFGDTSIGCLLKKQDRKLLAITYHAEELGEKFGLSNLWVAFHGYWPEKDALCPTGSFKDMEAVPTIQRMKDHSCKGMICASAGNTARAFTHFVQKIIFRLS